MLQTEPVKKLQSFAENNEQTQGKFTIGNEKVGLEFCSFKEPKADQAKEYNVFMRVNVRSSLGACKESNCADFTQDPTVQKATGKTDAVDVMGALREMKNNM